MAKNVFIADKIHINKKNFNSFFNYCEEADFKIIFSSSRDDLINKYGNYEGIKSILSNSKKFSKLSAKKLYDYSYRGHNVFKLCKAELLTYLLTKKNWYNSELSNENFEVLQKAFLENKRDLFLNFAMTLEWIDFWYSELDKSPLLHYAVIFSGSLIYQKSLISILMRSVTKVFIAESSFTGNDYYLEEKYTFIANNSDIRHSNIYEAIRIPDDANLFERAKNKAINKYFLMKNKNVQQPYEAANITFKEDLPTILILAQVVNDFSMIEFNISSVYFYKRLIKELSKYNLNIIIKTHPWEEKKDGVKGKLTYDELDYFIKTELAASSSKFHIIDHHPINHLFELADHVIGLNSQSLLESCFNGFKPIQFGKAFYGNKGFTYDYDLESVSEMCLHLSSGKLKSHLNLNEYNLFEEFLVKFLQHHLVSIHKSGLIRLREIFQNPSFINVINRKVEFLVPSVPNNNIIDSVFISERVDKKKSLLEAILPSSAKAKKLTRDPKLYFKDAGKNIIKSAKEFIIKK